MILYYLENLVTRLGRSSKATFLTVLTSSGMSLSIGKLSSSTWQVSSFPKCFKTQILSLAINTVSCFPGRNTHFVNFCENDCQVTNQSVSSVAQSCPTFCDAMNCSTPGFPVFHHLQEFAQTHVYWVGDAIQSSCPLLSPSLPVFNLSQH